MILHISRVARAYFNKNNYMRVLAFNSQMSIAAVSGLVVAATMAIIRLNTLVVVINCLVSALSFALLYIGNKKGCYRLCSWISIVFTFFLAFPALFFYSGGHPGGASFLFIIAIVYTAMLLKKIDRVVALAIETSIYILCLLGGIYWTEFIVALSSESDYFTLTILNLTLACVFLSGVLLIRARAFEHRQAQIQELNRELVAVNEALERYDKMKSDFLSTVAHEINTPLSVIAASSSDTIDLLNESPINAYEIMDNQRVIERRVKMIDSMLLDLMDTVAIESGRLTLRREPILLAERIRDVCDEQHKKLDVNNNAIEYHFQPGLPQIWADPIRIEQVMINLLSNAFRYTRNGSISVRIAQEDGKQIVSVKDNGEGMDEEMAKIALKQYVSSKSEHWRHGIGLYICRRIVLAHGGDIHLESEKGKGTTVTFALRELEEGDTAYD